MRGWRRSRLSRAVCSDLQRFPSAWTRRGSRNAFVGICGRSGTGAQMIAVLFHARGRCWQKLVSGSGPAARRRCSSGGPGLPPCMKARAAAQLLFPQMQEREGSRSGAGGRLVVVHLDCLGVDHRDARSRDKPVAPRTHHRAFGDAGPICWYISAGRLWPANPIRVTSRRTGRPAGAGAAPLCERRHRAARMSRGCTAARRQRCRRPRGRSAAARRAA
jgi:hypothetical protein